MLDNLPLWISGNQAKRLVQALEAQGFTDPKVRRGEGAEIVVTATDNGQDFNVRAGNPMDLEVVVPRFVKWREHRNG